jgi:hypothetical protein
MTAHDYSAMHDEQLCELMFTMEDRLPKEAALELAGRETVVTFMGQLLMDKQNWLAELPEWWAVVHSAYLLGYRGGEGAVIPLVSTLRWADAFDCDWVTEVLPSIMGKTGPAMLPQLTAVVRDLTAGWSARDLAMKGMASVTVHYPECNEHVFRIIGERLMDEGEHPVVRQLSGQVLLDFRRAEFHLPLLKFARQTWKGQEWDSAWNTAFSPENVESALRSSNPEVWHYNEDWMRFYEPSEIQRRQKRWSRERLAKTGERRGSDHDPGGSGGRVVSLATQREKSNDPPGSSDPGNASE